MNSLSPASGCRSEYCEYLAPLALQGRLLCFWTQRITGSQGVYSHRVLPDACVDIVFINDAPPLLVGPWRESFVADFAPGTQVLGVRFHPGSAAALLNLSASELLNLSLPLRDVCGCSRSTQFAPVRDKRSLPGKRAALESIMSRWLSRSVPGDDSITAALRWLARHPAGRIDWLCQEIGVSSRQLRRRFLATVGYGPKLFQSVLRFQRLLNLAGRLPARSSLALLAAEAGYADQPHMTREVRRFSGQVPTALLESSKCTLQLSGLLSSDCSS